ncbi:MAG: sugar ABC transporter substrate-binding protein [Thermoleophilaceae bacterium]
MKAHATTAPRRLRRLLPLFAVLVVSVVVAGCGSDDNSSSGTGKASTAAGTSTAASGIVAEAQKMVAEANKPLEFKPPGPPIDASKLKGKTLAIVTVDERVPILSLANKATQQAAKEVGIKVTSWDAKSQVNRMQQGIEQAARQADAMILSGIPIAAVGGALEAAKKAGVPSVSVLNNQPDPNAPGQGAGPLVGATSAPNYEHGGALVAAKAIVDTDGKVNTTIFDTKEITPSPDVVRGMKSVLDKCSQCKVDMNTTPLAEWATALTPKAQSTVRKNPNLNYILPIFDDMGVFITAGIQQAGASDRVKVAALDGTPAALKVIQDGDVFTANPGQPTGWLGWHALDQAMRLMLGDKPGNPEIPSRLLDDENLKGVDVENIDAPYGNPKYREGFRQLWGLS